MRIVRLSYRVKGFVGLYNYAIKHTYMITDKARFRVKVLLFWEKHGLEATIDAFPVKRSTLFLWKQKLKEGGGRLEVLNDVSRAPRVRRRRLWPLEVIDEIKRMRQAHPNLGKDKVRILLKEAFGTKEIPEGIEGRTTLHESSAGGIIPLPSPSTIGRLIKDCGGLRAFPQKITHFGKIVPLKRKEVLRKPKNFKAEYPGHLVALDTIEKFINGCRRYVITFEDVHTRFSFAWATNSHASKAAKEFFDYCRLVFPHPFAFVHVLTDNGSEFAKHFSEEVKRLHLIHYHTYPKTPKMNAHCERFNRTIQEEFINYHEQELLEPLSFNQNLIEWLLWYNTKRPHWALKLLSPLQFMLSLNPQLTPQESNFGWTNTSH